MEDLLILGAHAHAVEMAAIVQRLNAVKETWNLLGFVSPDDDCGGDELLGLPILAPHDFLEAHPSALVIPEFDWPNRSNLPLDRLATIIDPTVFVSQTAQIGRGCVIYPHCFIGAYAQIGDLFFCLSGSMINHNDVIGDRVTVTSSVTLAGDVHVEADCYLGQSCTVRELLKIGKGSMIGMGSVVLHNVPPNSVMVGNPARNLRSREPNFPGVDVLRAIKRSARMGVQMIRRL